MNVSPAQMTSTFTKKEKKKAPDKSKYSLKKGTRIKEEAIPSICERRRKRSNVRWNYGGEASFFEIDIEYDLLLAKNNNTSEEKLIFNYLSKEHNL
jgi:hypothetical protein